MNDMSRSLHLRAVFISDVHLGARDCQAEKLANFLRNLNCNRLFLVGDIVDGWKMKGGWCWRPSHHDVVQQVLRLAREGAMVTYIPGNHDDRLRAFCGVHFAGVQVAREAEHQTADGRRFLVTHGDEFDELSNRPAWHALAGDLAYKALLGTQHRHHRRAGAAPTPAIGAFRYTLKRGFVGSVGSLRLSRKRRPRAPVSGGSTG